MKFKKIIFTAIRLLFFVKDGDTEKVLVSNKIYFCEKNYKYFIDYLYNDHKVNDHKYNTIRDKSSADNKKEFDSKPAHNKELLKNKIKSDGDEVSDFYDKKVSKVDSNHTYLTVIGLDLALKEDQNY